MAKKPKPGRLSGGPFGAPQTNGRAHRGKPAGPVEPSEEGPELTMEPASDTKVQKVSWLWKDRLEWGSVAVMQGSKGAGKSTWLRAIAADVTGGPRLPGEKGRPRVAGSVLWFAGEESRSKVVIPGLKAAGADMKLVHTADNLGEESVCLGLPNDCERLRRIIDSRQAALVVIDPVLSFLDGSLDIEGGSVQARKFIGYLLKIASPSGCLILLSRNLTKDTSRGALAAGRGSGELGNAARSVLHCHGLPNTLDDYAIAVASCNNGPPAPTLLFRFDDSKGFRTVAVNRSIQLTADELCAGEDGDLDRTNLEAAKELIRQMLPAGQELESSTVRAKAEQAMISTRTLQLAAQRLGLVFRRVGARAETKVFWKSPKAYPERSK